MNLKCSVCLGAVACLLCVQAQAGALVLKCPSSIQSRQAATGQVAKPWSVRAGGKPIAEEASTIHRLEGVIFSAGDPKEGAWLVGEVLKETAGRATLVRAASSPAYPLFMTCHYQGTVLQVTQAVPAEYTRCDTSLDVGTLPATPIQTVCRTGQR